MRNRESDNVNVHRAAAKIIVSKSRAARGSVCNVLLSGALNSNAKHARTTSTAEQPAFEQCNCRSGSDFH